MKEYCRVLSLQTQGQVFAVLHLQMILVLSLCYRTLLALGCHIAHVNPAAEEELKKVKLPKK